MEIRDVIENPDLYDFKIDSIQKPLLNNPITHPHFVDADDKISYATNLKDIHQQLQILGRLSAFEKAGPRNQIMHDPESSVAGIITCGGLCPGLNDVIKGLVLTLLQNYQCRRVYGFRFGYMGLAHPDKYPPLELDPEAVDTIHQNGGTILGSSRGLQQYGDMIETLLHYKVNMLFCIGGDGTLKGAQGLCAELKKRNLPINVIGVPKTIDNDLGFMDRTFGFETAVYSTTNVITSAHVEARGVPNGIGLVKLMGRDSGFIAAYASLANSVVDFCLIPEVAFRLESEGGLLPAIAKHFEKGNKHLVIVVAEGAGQDLFDNQIQQKDASGNVKKNDIGLFLKEKILDYFKSRQIMINVKYFDPSYQIRSVPAHGTDAIFCLQLAKNAVHAAMAGKTNLVIGHWSNHFTHVPLHLATRERKKINPDDSIWRSLLASTNQGAYMSCF